MGREGAGLVEGGEGPFPLPTSALRGAGGPAGQGHLGTMGKGLYFGGGGDTIDIQSNALFALGKKINR